MRILWITHRYGAEQDNLYGPTSKLLNHLGSLDCQVSVLVPAKGSLPEPHRDNVTIVLCPGQCALARYFYLFLYSLLYLRSNSVDVIYTHTSAYSGFIGVLCSLISSTPQVHWLCGDGKDSDSKRFRIKRIYGNLLYLFIHLNSKVMIGCCAHTLSHQATFFCKIFDFRSKYKIVPNCVDTKLFKPEASSKLMGVTPVVGYVSRLSHRKGFDLFIDAVCEVAEYRNLKVVIVGDGPLKNTLSKLRDKGIDVEYHQSIKNTELYHLINKFDFLCVPARYQGFGRVYVEALACGVPVLASNLPCTQEIIHDGYNGWLVEPDTLQVKNKILEVIEHLMHNQNIYAQCEHSAAYYSVENVSLKYKLVFEEAVL